jgi:predicted Zn-dependent protease
MTKVDEAMEKVASADAKELSAQEQDELANRAAAVAKATERLIQQADYMSKIAAVVEKTLPEFIAKNPLGQSVDLFVSLEDAMYAVDEQLKAVRASISNAREVSFPARLDAEDCKTTTSKDTGHRMTRTARIFASIVSSKTEAAYQWLRENNLGALIKPTVNSSSLSAAAKEALENGTEFPDDIFTIHTKDSVSITKGKKK